MQATGINKRLIDGYLELFENLSSANKRDLISALSDSLDGKKSLPENSLKAITGDFISEKNAESIIWDLKNSRSFTSDREAL